MLWSTSGVGTGKGVGVGIHHLCDKWAVIFSCIYMNLTKLVAYFIF